MIPYTLLVEKQAGRLIAKGKRQFRNRVITDKGKGRKSPLVKVELAPDDFLELTLSWKSFSGVRKIVPSSFVKFLLFTLLNACKEKEIVRKENKCFLLFKGEIPQEFFVGIERLISGIPLDLKRIQFRKLLREVGYG